MTRLELVPFAEAELAAREKNYPKRIARGSLSADEAGRKIAAWRSIVALLRNGAVELEPCLCTAFPSHGSRAEDCPQRGPVGVDGRAVQSAWLQLVDVATEAVNHRAGRNEPSCWPLIEIRSLLMRSAVRAGARLPSFDEPEAQAA